jgi:hypothetical protein
MNVQKKISFESKYIFSLKEDLISFIFPLFAAAFFYKDSYTAVGENAFSNLIFKVLIGGGHIAATIVPIFFIISAKQYVKKNFILSVLLILSFIATNIISEGAFKNFLALYGLSHIFIQHLTWSKYLNTAGAVFSRKVVMATILIIPVTAWLFNLLPYYPSYFYKITLFDQFNFNHLNATAYLPLSLFAVFLGSIRKTCDELCFNVSNFIFYLSTWIWIVFGLLVIQKSGFFITYLAVSHGLSYIVYISKNWPQHKNIVSTPSNKYLVTSVLCALGGYLWYAWDRMTSGYSESNSWATFIPWLPLLIHYSFDLVIWKKTMTTIPVRALKTTGAN